MRNLSRLILKLDESLIELTLVYDGGVFSLYQDDKKSKGYNDREIKTLLSKIDATALDFSSSQKRDIDKMISVAKGSSSNQVDLSANSTEVVKLRLV